MANYKMLQSNSAVNVIEVDGEVIQLSTSINIEDFLKSRNSLINVGDSDNIMDMPKVKGSKGNKRLPEAVETK